MRLPIVRLICSLFAIAACAPALAEDLPWDTSPSTAWPAGPGQARIELRGDYLKDFGIDVEYQSGVRNERHTTDIEITSGRLWAWVPYGNFEAFNGGQLSAAGGFMIRRGDFVADFTDMVLVPSEDNKSAQLQIIDSRGNHLATITHAHAVAYPERGELRFESSDVQGSDWLFTQLGLPKLGGTPLGQLSLSLALRVPTDANLSKTSPDRGGLSCQDRPFWPQDNEARPQGRPEHLVDVELTEIGNIAYQGTEGATDRIKVAPSATLQSVGFGDAAWEEKFGQLGPYPFEPRDQHPFLVWNMYRISDGRIEQLGASGVKHAWLTINFGCSINCGNNNILWPGCKDVYGSSTNDNNRDQGPRSEIFASEGLFFSSPSFFDPGDTGDQTNFAADFENRLMISKSDLQVVGAEYFLDAWYVVMADVNIWNSMGYHSINPQAVGSGWTFGTLGPITPSTPIENWVAANTTDPMEGHRIVEVDGPTPAAEYPNNLPSGHLRVLARAIDLGQGEYRYNYAVMNFDFDNGISEFFVPLPSGAQVSETFMTGPADVLSSAWTASVEPGGVRFSAPAGDKLPWFTLYNFELVVDQAPAADGSVALIPASPDGDVRHLPAKILVDMVAPASASERVFADRFEAP